MITCPECGLQANDDARFCDRCGHGFAQAASRKPASSIAPLAEGTELKHGFRIVELLSQVSHENRYRAERMRNGKVERFQLREQIGPGPRSTYETTIADESVTTKPPADVSRAAEDPNGPRAKTADLKLKPVSKASEQTSSTNGSPDGVSGKPVESAERAGSASPAAAGETEHGDQVREGEVQSSVQQEATSLQQNSAYAAEASAVVLTDAAAHTETPAESGEHGNNAGETVPQPHASVDERDDLGDLFGRVLALSLTLNHPAFQRAVEGFSHEGRVYLAYPDEQLTSLSRRRGGLKMSEPEALNVAIQLCQAVSFVNRRGLRVNDICPDSVAYGSDGRIRLTGLDYVSNDNELQSEPIFNDGYTAPEIYRAKKVDKRADVFSVGALLYTCLTGERLESEAWLEEAGPVHFYPPHVVTPALEQAVRRALVFNPAARWANVDALKAELVHLNGHIRVRSGVLTDVGMVRELNEDSVMAVEYARDSLIEPSQNFLYVVADGMGGAEAGEMASAIAVGAIRNYVEGALKDGRGADIGQLLRDALEAANTRILEYQAEHPESRGMGSTGVSILISPPEAAVAWVGDSRGYFCDGAGLRQLTRDHSLVQRLIEIGQITAEEARHHEHKNVITRSLGARPNGPAGAESVSLRLKRGDRLMLCSDGLTAHVEDKEIGEILRRQPDPYEAARELVVAANAGGGTDNVSVIVILAG
jgi:serine/threonine protein phosphatase PrpC